MAWRDLIIRLNPGCRFSSPASTEAITLVEETLGLSFPPDLVGFLQETNGASFALSFPWEEAPLYFSLGWSIEEILEENQNIRDITKQLPKWPLPEAYLFFASMPNGDFVAFDLAHPGGHGMVIMSHDDYSRRDFHLWSLKDFFLLLLEASAKQP